MIYDLSLCMSVAEILPPGYITGHRMCVFMYDVCVCVCVFTLHKTFDYDIKIT